MTLSRAFHLSSFAVVTAGIFAACGGDDGAKTGVACVAPMSTCSGSCVNTGTDPNNCGACGTTCDFSKGLVCSQGACGLTCGGGATKCGSSCVDTANDPKNCGMCSMACATGQVCATGACAAACPSGQTMCSGGGGSTACVSTQTDPNNCGMCGQACPLNNSCVAGACAATLANTSPVLVSNATTSCTTDDSYRGRKVAVDPSSNELFVAMNCGGDVQVATSSSGGVTFGAPVDLKTTGVLDTAIILDSMGTVYVGTITGAGALSVLSSADHGVTWSAPTLLESGLFAGDGLSMDVYKTTLYVAAHAGANVNAVHVWRNGAADAGAGFTMTNVSFGTTVINPFDVLVDPASGNVWVAGDANGALTNAMSSDGGMTFGPAVTPPGNVVFSDMAFSSGTIFMGGSSDTLVEVKASAPATDTTIPGFGMGAFAERAVAADSSGDVFVATHVQGGANDLILQHVSAGGTTIDKSPVIAPGGSSPAVTSAGTNVAFVAYSSNGGVYARVIKF